MKAGSEINFATTMGLLTRCNPLVSQFLCLTNLGYSISVFFERLLNFWVFGQPVSLVLGLLNEHKRGIDLTALRCPCSNLS